jgi:hypothetical protein
MEAPSFREFRPNNSRRTGFVMSFQAYNIVVWFLGSNTNFINAQEGHGKYHEQYYLKALTVYLQLETTRIIHRRARYVSNILIYDRRKIGECAQVTRKMLLR